MVQLGPGVKGFGMQVGGGDELLLLRQNCI